MELLGTSTFQKLSIRQEQIFEYDRTHTKGEHNHYRIMTPGEHLCIMPRRAQSDEANRGSDEQGCKARRKSHDQTAAVDEELKDLVAREAAVASKERQIQIQIREQSGGAMPTLAALQLRERELQERERQIRIREQAHKDLQSRATRADNLDGSLRNFEKLKEYDAHMRRLRENFEVFERMDLRAIEERNGAIEYLNGKREDLLRRLEDTNQQIRELTEQCDRFQTDIDNRRAHTEQRVGEIREKILALVKSSNDA